MPSIGKEEEQSRKLFIGGISYETTDESMKDYFGKYGSITDCVVIKDNDSGKSKGFGFVTFEIEEEADKCMDERPHTLHNRTVDVKRAVSREESMKPGAHVQVKKIFIGGVREDVDNEELKAYFSQFGNIVEFEVPVDRDTQKPRGFAFITFDDYDTVDKLVAKRHHEICGRRCEVKKALSKNEMEKARMQVEQKQHSRYSSRSGPYSGSQGMRPGRRSGGGREPPEGSYGSCGGYGGGYGGYGGGYEDSYDSYGRGGYGNGSGYGSGGGGGPMRSSHGQRAGGPYGGGYGSGGYSGGYEGYGGYGDRASGGGYEDSGYGGYGGGGGRYGKY